MGKVLFMRKGNKHTKPSSQLPSGYTKLAYIQSSGAQNIDTLFYPKYNSRVVVDIEGLGTNNQFVFGTRNANSATSSLQFNIFRNSATTIRSDYFGTNKAISVADTSERTVIDKNGNVVTMFGQTVANTAVSTGTCTYSLYLFALNEVGITTSWASYKLYSCHIYDNGTLVRDYVPCINPSGAVGLYDLVGKKFYGNAGTGAFTGSEVA